MPGHMGTESGMPRFQKNSSDKKKDRKTGPFWKMNYALLNRRAKKPGILNLSSNLLQIFNRI